MKCSRLVDAGRRQFLRGGGVAAVGAAAATMGAPATAATPLARVAYPATRLANLAELTVNEPLDIAYPDADSPGVLIKLGTAVPGGVGPDGDVVAYSVLCPHKGWRLQYNSTDRTLNCPGHWSRFDCEAGGLQVFGHATQNLPQFALRVDEAGDIHAEGADELIYGRLSNVLG